ncbi:hypothetical protein EGT74_04455 [Chitinophaga lutea]|uniref:Neutral/alkaline non-lysosomal ceramidase N-terminal domain-containing protein n=2 Tax=Chitinophaga lutea TaxID=2488634 RepID=A0A3N4PVY6_9BACT|nr:hypothetical protein EGT74_04455 [Chitinophaga lutea]
MNMQFSRYLLCTFLFLYCYLPGKGQQYRAGFARESTEPAAWPFSLTLAGYGAPTEGRFSLEWIKTGEIAGGGVALTGGGSALFATDGHSLFTAPAGHNNPAWQEAGAAANVRLLAAAGNTLYAIDAGGALLETRLPLQKQKRPVWASKGSAGNATAIAVLHRKLYIATPAGLQYTDVRGGNLQWKNMPAPGNVISLAAYNNELYVLTADDNIYRRNPAKDSNWLRMARHNGLTYNVRLRHIAVAGNTLYGCDAGGNLFIAKHNSDGNMSASALAIAAGKQRVVIVGLDVCGFDHAFAGEVKQEISKKLRIPPQAVMLNASHTHFAPVAQPYITWHPPCQQPDSSYLHAVVRPAVVRAVSNAIRNLAPSSLYFSRSKTAIGRNRCLSTAPLPYDNDVDVITAVRSDNQEKTVLFLTGCHPVFNASGREGVTLSANYPAVARTALEGKDNIRHAVFVQGCAGDINPQDANHTNTGNALAADVRQAMAGSMTPITGPITCYTDSISFPTRPMAKAAVQTMYNDNAKNAGQMIPDRNVRWARMMQHYYNTNTMPATMPVYVQTINIGNWKLVGLSREVVTEYGSGIKALYPGSLVSVAGYCNDVASYLPTSRHMKEGTYEGLDSFFWYGQPSQFPVDVYETVLDNIRRKNR